MTRIPLLDQYLAAVRRYLSRRSWDDVPLMAGRTFLVTPLAGGEYNLNYLLESAAIKLVFRVNIASQINRQDQILYEYSALRLLQQSGVTPRPYFVDDSRELIDRGISIMEFLPGEPLDYSRDLTGAASTLATIHQLDIGGAANHLIVEEHPLTLIFNECADLLETYFHSDLAVGDVRSFLLEVKSWARQAKTRERYFIDNPWLCIVNTEVNSANFIVDRILHKTSLIDWEMPRWGDPSTDLCHFLSPLTTLWKTSFRFSAKELALFIRLYKENLRCPDLRETLDERMRRKFPFVLLRGISWSAMAWIAYQTDYQGIRHEDTWQKISQYLEIGFIRSLFEPFMKNR